MEYSCGNYRVTSTYLLDVHTGPGDTYKKLTYRKLTRNARAQIYDWVRYRADGYVRGVEFTVYEVIGIWGRTPSGWVRLDYCEKID